MLFNLALANCIVPENIHTSPKKVVLVWTLPHHFQFWFILSFKYFVFWDLSPSELPIILLWVGMDIFWNQTFCSWNTPSTVDSQKGKAWKCGLNACNLDDWSGCVKFNVSYSRSLCEHQVVISEGTTSQSCVVWCMYNSHICLWWSLFWLQWLDLDSISFAPNSI